MRPGLRSARFCHAAKKAWSQLSSNAMAVIVVLTLVNILIGLICTSRQLAILSKNSNSEYRPYVYVGLSDWNGDFAELSSNMGNDQVVVRRLDSTRVLLWAGLAMARNSGKGPAKEVAFGIYLSRSPSVNVRLAKSTKARRFSLPPGSGFSQEYSDETMFVRAPNPQQGSYLHVFALYWDVSGRMYTTDKAYILDSLIPTEDTSQQRFRYTYRSTEIR